MSEPRQAQLPAVNEAVSTVVGLLVELRDNAAQSGYLAENWVNPTDYPDSVQKGATDLAATQSGESSRLRTHLVRILKQLDQATRHASDVVRDARHDFAGILGESDREFGGYTDSSLHASVVTFASSLLEQASKVSGIPERPIESANVPVEELLPPATLQGDSKDIEPQSRPTLPPLTWLDDVTPDGILAVRTWTIVDMMGYGSGMSIPTSLDQLPSRLEAELGVGLRSTDSVIDQPNDFSLTAEDVVAGLKKAGIQCSASALSKWKNGHDQPRGWKLPRSSLRDRFLISESPQGRELFSRSQVGELKQELLRIKNAAAKRAERRSASANQSKRHGLDLDS